MEPSDQSTPHEENHDHVADNPAPVVVPTPMPDPTPTVSPIEQTVIQPQAPAPTPLVSPELPNQTPSISVPPAAHNSSAGLLVLQWLTYAFWGWTVLMMSILTATVLANFISGADTSGFTPYGAAAVLVLLPISITCDVFYSKREPEKKTGAASLIMVIHAVLFALFGIGSLIVVVFSLLNMFTSSSDHSNTKVALFSALIIFFLYLMTFLRTINLAKLPQIRRFYPIAMAICVVIITVLGFTGPVANAHRTKDDTLIVDNLNNLNDDINSYVQDNNNLPSSLQKLDLSNDPDTQQLVTRKLVTYTSNTYTPPVINHTPGTGPTTVTNASKSKTYYYQLCVTYKQASKGTQNFYPTNTDQNGYNEYLNLDRHPAGQVCYKLKSVTYNY